MAGGGTFCSVASCTKSYWKCKRSGEPVRFFTFPKDPKVRREWIKRCSRDDKFNPGNHKRICSIHFKPEDYQSTTALKKTAVPSLYLKPPPTKKGAVRPKKRQQVKPEVKPPESTGNSGKDTSSDSSECDLLRYLLRTLQEENTQLKVQIEDHVRDKESLRIKLGLVEEQLKATNVNLEDRVQLAFRDFLTSNQVEVAVACRKQVRTTWSPDELSRAFTLRYFSK